MKFVGFERHFVNEMYMPARVYFLYRDCYGHSALNLYKIKFHLSLSYSNQFDFYQHQSEEHVEN